jgi:hypothetical protein
MSGDNYMRKIIQLLETQDSEYTQGYITALCDDGTIWFYQGSWEPMKDQIPQVKIEEFATKEK